MKRLFIKLLCFLFTSLSVYSEITVALRNGDVCIVNAVDIAGENINALFYGSYVTFSVIEVSSISTDVPHIITLRNRSKISADSSFYNKDSSLVSINFHGSDIELPFREVESIRVDNLILNNLNKQSSKAGEIGRETTSQDLIDRHIRDYSILSDSNSSYIESTFSYYFSSEVEGIEYESNMLRINYSRLVGHYQVGLSVEAGRASVGSNYEDISIEDKVDGIRRYGLTVRRKILDEQILLPDICASVGYSRGDQVGSLWNRHDFFSIGLSATKCYDPIVVFFGSNVIFYDSKTYYDDSRRFQLVFGFAALFNDFITIGSKFYLEKSIYQTKMFDESIIPGMRFNLVQRISNRSFVDYFFDLKFNKSRPDFEAGLSLIY